MRGSSRFFDLLFPPRDTERLVRKIDEEQLAQKLTPIRLPRADMTTLLPYRDEIVHALIIEAKYHGNARATHLLAGILAEYLLEYLSEENALDRTHVVLVPLPLSKRRKQERGYNQVEAVLGKTAVLLGSTVEVDTSVLTRVRHTTPQTRLGRRGRETNMEGAFAATRVHPAYLYIVVDDVYTTGATLGEALRTLRGAGACHLRAIALAH